MSFTEVKYFSLILLLVFSLSACEKEKPPTWSSSPQPRILIETNISTNQSSALADYAEGIVAESQEDLKSALSAYHSAFEKDPTYEELGPYLVGEYLKQKQPAKALKPLKKLIQKEPTNSSLYSQQAFIYSLLNQRKLANDSIETALHFNPTNYFAYALLYQLQASNSVPNALKLLQNKAPTLSTQSFFWQSVGEAYASVLDDQEPTSLTTSQIAQKTLPLFQKALEHSPTNLPLLLRLAELNELATNPVQAITLYQKAITLSTNREPIETRLAAAYLNSKNTEKAIQTLEAILRRNPRNPNLHLTLANLYYQQRNTNRFEFYLAQADAQGVSKRLLGDFASQIKDWPLAEFYLKKVIQVSTGNPDTWIQLANALAQQNKIKEALSYIKQAQKKFPSTPEIFLMSSLLARENQDYFQASNFLFQAEQIATNAPKSNLALEEIAYQWGIFYEQKENFEQAEVHFKKAIALNPKHHQAMNYLSYMWAERKIKLEEALILINQALLLEPKNPAYLDTLGWIYFQKGNYEKALPPIREAFELSAYDGEIGEHLGDIYLKLNQNYKALEVWEKALRSEPDREPLKKKIQSLKK